MLPHGQEAARDTIPWSQVNDGWNLRAWAPVADPTVTDGAITPTLYLINPIGGRYEIGIIPAFSTVALWSPDHRRAIIRHGSAAGTQTLEEWELSTGKRLTSFAQGDRTLLAYTWPLGRALLFSYPARGDQIQGLERVGTDGSHQLSYPGSEPQTGAFQDPTVLYTPDGAHFVIAGQRGFAVFSNGGTLVRQIPNPPGTEHCRLTHWWSDREMLAACATPATGGTSVRNVFRIAMDSADSKALTAATAPDYGFLDAWEYSGGTLAQRAGSCGPGGLVNLSSSGAPRPFTYSHPAGVTGLDSVTGVYDDRATVVTGICGKAGRSLFSLDLRTRATSVLLGPGLNSGTVY